MNLKMKIKKNTQYAEQHKLYENNIETERL